jgi:tRNA threonylcarbamoyladenosine biosynthesis protein TsaB
MTGLLAIDTATDACSVALLRDGHVQQCLELAPRRHNQLLFTMLRELLPGGDLRSHGVHAIAYGTGPGSFTGLRIAASAVQGLAYASGLPILPVSTLACQAQTALRDALVAEGDTVLSVIDARIGEIYWALFHFEGGLARPLSAAAACVPEELAVPGTGVLQVVGSGAAFADQFSASVRGRVDSVYRDVYPQARDMVPLALAELAAGGGQDPRQAQPLYVRDEISWKKLPEQGKRQ